MAIEWGEHTRLKFEEGPTMNISIVFGNLVEDVDGSVVLGACSFPAWIL